MSNSLRILVGDVRLPKTELRLVLAFLLLSGFDALLTILLVSKGYLCMELMPGMKSLFIVFGPPGYSYEVFVASKMALTFGGVLAIFYLVRIAPRMRRFLFILPVFILTIVCMVNLIGYLGSA